MTSAFFKRKSLPDADVVLGIAYFIHSGPDEATGPATAFLAGIGAQNTEANQRILSLIVSGRKAGIDVVKMISLERVAADLMGWDSVRVAVALAEAQAAGMLTAVGKKEPS